MTGMEKANMKLIRVTFAVSALAVLGGCIAVPVNPGYYEGYHGPVYYSKPAYYVRTVPSRAGAAYPPPPPPVVKPAPAPKRFTLSADAIFNFDQPIVKPEGRRQPPCANMT
jgi:hypothetical protein